MQWLDNQSVYLFHDMECMYARNVLKSTYHSFNEFSVETTKFAPKMT